VASRATKLDEFSHYGKLFTLGRFSKVTEVAQHIGPLFFHETSYVLILTKKRVWLCTLSAIFSQTHPVTLVASAGLGFLIHKIPLCAYLRQVHA
jgi:hypothetical protein